MIRPLPKNGIPTVVIGDGKWGNIKDVAEDDFIRIERVNNDRMEFLYMLVRAVSDESVSGNVLDEQNRKFPGLKTVPFKEMMQIEIWAKNSCYRLLHRLMELKDTGYCSTEQVANMPMEEINGGLRKMGLDSGESSDGFRN